MMLFGLSTTYYALALVTAALATPLQVTPRQAPFRTTPISDFAEPWALAFLPDNRILVTEKRGNLRLINPTTNLKGEITGVPRVVYGGQGGLGDVALHPQFAANNLVYISYAEPGTAGSGPRAAVARARLVLNNNGGGALQGLQVVWRQSPHNAQNGQFGHRILFGANSTMWISSGERQLFDPAQVTSSNLGKILRLNDDGTVPEGNPFASTGGDAAQVWALGIRNPLGIDFDDQGRLWEIEMGPMGGDEFNLIERGANYGWPIVSQGDHYDGRPIPDHSTRPEFNPPKAFWVPVISPAGMIIYKGDLFPNWKGNALISALGAQGLVRVEMSGNTAREAQRVSMGRRMRAIRESVDGAVWMLEDGPGGRLLKLTPS